MSLKIELTSDWELERIEAIWSSVLACIRRFVNEFPEEATETQIIEDILSGARQLWVVYDEDQPTTALLAVMTASKEFVATGVSFVEIVGIGGERIREALPLIDNIEQWAEKQGAKGAIIIGRFGWIPMLKERGYKKKAVILKKVLGDNQDGQLTKQDE